MFLYLFILVMSLLSPVSYAGSGKDRCAVSNCTCEVKPGPYSPSTSTKIQTTVMSVYFLEDKHNLTANQIREIKKFVKAPGKYTVLAYTDGCASYSHNKSLALRRLSSVGAYIESNTNKIVPEESSHHSPKSRRVDIVRKRDISIRGIIETVDVDVYLLDASGSMAGSQSWKDIASASFRKGKKIYVSKMTNCRDGQTITSVPYGGGTEIWYSYWWVLNQMNYGESLLVVSDFRANYGLKPTERATLEALVRKKNIKVYSITLK